MSLPSSKPTAPAMMTTMMNHDGDDESVTEGYDYPCAVNKGKWTTAEVEYMLCLIDAFKAGYLPLKNGTTLRGFLSKRLSCKPKRISKRFEGIQYNGRLPYTKCQPTVRNLEAAKQALDVLKQLEKRYLEAETSSGATAEDNKAAPPSPAAVARQSNRPFACQERSVPKRMVCQAAKCGLLGSEVAASERRKEVARTLQQARARESAAISRADAMALFHTNNPSSSFAMSPRSSFSSNQHYHLASPSPAGFNSSSSRDILETLLAASSRDGSINFGNLRAASPSDALQMLPPPRQVSSNASDLATRSHQDVYPNPIRTNTNNIGFMMNNTGSSMTTSMNHHHSRLASLGTSNPIGGGLYRSSSISQPSASKAVLGMDVLPLPRMESDSTGGGLPSFMLDKFKNGGI